jgi:hypothetical protein
MIAPFFFAMMKFLSDLKTNSISEGIDPRSAILYNKSSKNARTLADFCEKV